MIKKGVNNVNHFYGPTPFLFYFRVGPHEVFKQIIRCYFYSFRLKVLFGAQKGALKAKYQPLLWDISHDIYKLAWSDPIFI